MIFRIDQLRQFFETLTAYPVVALRDFDGGNQIILRHDIDLDVRPAYEFALLENEYGLRATYFFLTTAHTYNLASATNRRMLRAIADMGFEVALHFDPLVYGDVNEETLQICAEKEAAFISELCGQPVQSVSVHNPSVHGQYPHIHGFNNAYDSKYFDKARYISDSLMTFRDNIFEFIQQADAMPLQILLHPLHFTETGADYRGIMAVYLEHMAAEIDANFRAANPVYRQVFDGTPLIDYIRSTG